VRTTKSRHSANHHLKSHSAFLSPHELHLSVVLADAQRSEKIKIKKYLETCARLHYNKAMAPNVGHVTT